MEEKKGQFKVNVIRVSEEAAEKLRGEMVKKRELLEKHRKSFLELEEGVDYKKVETDIGKGNPKCYPVKQIVPISEKGRNWFRGKD